MSTKLQHLPRLATHRNLTIAGLPWEIIELMKEPSERSEKVTELFKGMLVTSTDKILSFDIAAKHARDLQEFPKEKMIEVASDDFLRIVISFVPFYKRFLNEMSFVTYPVYPLTGYKTYPV